MKSCLITMVLLLSATNAVAAVKGHFKINTTIVAPMHAAAFMVRDQFNPRVWQVEAVLSDEAVDIQAAARDLSPHTHLINQKVIFDANYILLWIDPDGKVSMNAKVEGAQYLDNTESTLKAQLTTNSADRVAGRVYTHKPVQTKAGAYEVDLTFDINVTRNTSGQKLTPGGGEAGKAFMAIDQAIQKKDLKVLNQFLTDEIILQLQPDYQNEQEKLQSTIETLGVWLPKKEWKIVGGEIFGDDVALLEVEGKMFDTGNTSGLYVVRMIKTPAGWKLAEASMAGMLP